MIFFFYFLLFLVAFYGITKTFLRDDGLPPTPFPTLPVIGHLHLLKKPLHRALLNISHRHGTVLLLRFGSRRVLVVTSPSAAEECLTKNDITFANRPRLLVGKHFGYNYTSLGWAPYGDTWRNLRRISSVQILSTTRLQMLSPIRAEEVRLMIRKLHQKYYKTAVDMKKLLFELTLNVMMRMIAGKRYYGDDGDVAAAEEAREFRVMVAETVKLSGASNIGDFLPIFNWFGGVEKKMMALQRWRDVFFQSLVQEKRTSMGGGNMKKKTMIEVLLSLQQTEPENYSDTIIRGIIAVLLITGTDTSAGTLEWAMSLLNHPQVLKKAQKEIDTLEGQNRFIEESDLCKLPYMYCVIKETLRMCPAGPLLVPHESSKECTVGGYRVPSNTMLLINLWAIQNDPKTWDEPTMFKPERFEGLDGTRDGFKFFPFGSGRRSCPGEGLAMQMVGLALGSLLQCFDWERVSEEMVDMNEGVGLLFPKAQPLQTKCAPRPAMLNLISQI